MEFIRLTSTDLRSLLELYKQLDADNQCSAEQSESVWKEIEADANIRYFGAVDDGKVVSTCYAVYIPSGADRTEAHLFYENKGFNGESKKAFDMRLEGNDIKQNKQDYLGENYDE